MFKKMNLFSKSSVRLLEALLKKPSAKTYERELSRTSGVSIGSTNQNLKEFVRRGIVQRERKGKMYFYTVNLDNALVRQFKILFNVIELEPLIEEIKGRAEMTLFGSCAEGTDTEESDIDLLILTEEKQKVREIVSKSGSKIDRKISPIVVNADDFMKLKKEDKPLYDRASKGIKLLGR